MQSINRQTSITFSSFRLQEAELCTRAFVFISVPKGRRHEAKKVSPTYRDLSVSLGFHWSFFPFNFFSFSFLRVPKPYGPHFLYLFSGNGLKFMLHLDGNPADLPVCPDPLQSSSQETGTAGTLQTAAV